MPTITRTDGVVIAWGGQVEGPVQKHNAAGVPSGSLSFKTELGVGAAELHEVIVHVAPSVMDELGPQNTPERNDLARQCVAKYVEDHCRHRWVPGPEEHFILNNNEKMRGLRERVLKTPLPTLYICTVKLPRMDIGEAEDMVIEVYSLDNAIVKLKTRMNSDPKYDWDSARVVEFQKKT
jgi:hypothetical protein